MTASPDPLVDPRHGRFTLVPASYVFLLRGPAPAAPGGPPAAGTQVLLQLRRGTGYMDEHWAAAAAGHVERGETAFDAARREAAEEIDVLDLDLRLELVLHRTRGDLPVDERVDFIFTARSWTGEPRVVEPEKCAELRWVPLDALDTLPGPVVPHEREALARLGGAEHYVPLGFA
ncbi:NUDIX domain-containing protein [Nocardioides perillae]|uniref:8-oxo-dGTP pyrophosphatase MutT (NUDIX family) n=1 Tax=Nocardioides perillae TaxID=1119534 RepID=A0A7Y9RYA0_9ACTN|nr:8-oxo-dGTP pyrophosphatase MutT (NUDIX family) [Nocardioides perillae]